MTCPEQDRTSAYLDGELDAAASALAEAHLETCERCQAFAAAAAGLSEAMRSPAARFAAPPSLRTRIVASLDAEAAAMARPYTPARSKGFWWGALSGVGASGLAAALAVAVLIPPRRRPWPPASPTPTSRPCPRARPSRWCRATTTPSNPGSPAASRSRRRSETSRPRAIPWSAAGSTGSRAARRPSWSIAMACTRSTSTPGPTGARGWRPRRSGAAITLCFWKAGDLDLAAVPDTGTDELNTFVHLVQGLRE